MNYRILLLPFLALSALFVAGCDSSDVRITNLTPDDLAANLSNAYTITVSVKGKTTDLVKDSVRTYIVIDGEKHQMKQSPLSTDLFEYDYRLPVGQPKAIYYFLAEYDVNKRGFIKHRDAYTGLQTLSLTNRYALSLEMNRAPAGAKVAILGRGFKNSDTVYIGDQEALTSYSSSNTLYFTVPVLPTGVNYPVVLTDGDSVINVGSLQIDGGLIRVSPTSLDLRPNGRTMLAFAIDRPAPFGGVHINVTTDIPDNVIMPRVVIPEGSRSISIPVEGEGGPVNGELYIEATGYNPVRIPVIVR